MNRATLVFAILLVLLLTACHRHAPTVEKKSSSRSTYQLTRDGYYRVRKGDTLHAIAFNLGLDWRDIASWNHIPSPYLIYPDQELRLSPTGQKAVAGQSNSSSPVTTSSSRPAPSSRTVEQGSSSNSTTTTGLKTPQATTKTIEKKSATTAEADPARWLWPTEGRIISNFKANDPARNGIEIGGKEGQAITSTAAGEVVYSGNGLIGYGELIIIKHNDRMLSAYAHNRKRLVSEGDKVSAGMKIAEMGRDDRNQALLHFEIRINGTPGNPLNYLTPP